VVKHIEKGQTRYGETEIKTKTKTKTMTENEMMTAIEIVTAAATLARKAKQIKLLHQTAPTMVLHQNTRHT